LWYRQFEFGRWNGEGGIKERGRRCLNSEGGMLENNAGRREQRTKFRAYRITLRVQSYALNSETDLQAFDWLF
jgi:hypothetical protein